MKENQIEGRGERIPTKSEVMGIIMHHLKSSEGITILEEVSDALGLYWLDLSAKGEELGAINEYCYTRKGIMINGVETSETSIDVEYFQDGEVVGGDRVAIFDDQRGEWK